MGFNLEKFEAFAYSRNHEAGMRELLALLEGLDQNYGYVGSQFEAQPLQSVAQQEENRHLMTRIAAAISCFFADKELRISFEWQSRILNYHRWLSLIF